MKKNLGMFFGLPCCGAVAVLMGLCAFTPVSRADVAVNNEGYSSGGGLNGANELAQEFTMSGTGGSLSSLTLDLLITGGSGTAAVSVFNVNGSGVPTTLLAIVGTINVASSGDNAVSLISYPLLTGSASYAIVLQPSAAATAWEYTATAGSGGSGSLGGAYFYSGAWYQFGGNYLQMSLSTTPVPEVPMTGLVMGFGALAIALGRKLRLAVSNIA